MKATLLLKHYINHLSFYHLVIKENKALKNAILIISSATNFSLLVYFINAHNYYGIIITSIFLVMIGLLGRLFNLVTIRKNYGKEIKTNKFSWDINDFDKMVIAKIEKYLIESLLQNKQSLELVINLLEEKINDIKVRVYSVYSVMGMILLPIWVNFVNKNINGSDNGKILLSLIFIGSIIIYCVLMIKNIAWSLNVQLSQIKKLKFYLQEIVISII